MLSEDLAEMTDPMQRAALVMDICALRFRGYDWAKQQGATEPVEFLGALAEKFAAGPSADADLEKKFAVLFYMQRCFRHWGEGFLAYPESALGRAAVPLFLELCDTVVPQAWVDEANIDDWKRVPAETRKAARAVAKKWLAEIDGAKAASTTDMVITLKPRQWFAMQLWLDHTTEPFIYESPIRIEEVKPLRTGRAEIEVSFYDAFYPEGVQHKCYRLQVLHRMKTYMLCRSLEHEDKRAVWIGTMSSTWLKRISSGALLRAIENEPDLDASLNRFFQL